MENKKIEQMYLETAPKVYRYAMYMLDSKEKAEDVTAETFTRFIEQHQAKQIENTNAWLMGIARNIIFDKYKEKKLMTNIDYNSEILDENYSVENEVVDEATVMQVKDELKNLDEITQEVLVMKIWNDVKFDEIANLLNMSVNTVKSLYYRGIEQLKINIGERNKGKKLYSVNLPLIIAGILALAKTSEYVVSTNFLSSLASTLGLSLSLNVINSSIMTSNLISAATTAAAPAAKAGILATTGAKVAAVVVTTTAVIGTGAAGVVILNNQPANVVSQPTSYVSQPVSSPVLDPFYKLIKDLFNWESAPKAGEITWLTKEGDNDIKQEKYSASCVTANTDKSYNEIYGPSETAFAKFLEKNGWKQNDINAADGPNIHRLGFNKGEHKVVVNYNYSTTNPSRLEVCWSEATTEDMQQVEFSFKEQMSNTTYKVTASIPKASKVYDADTSNNAFAKKRIDLGAANLIFSTPYETFPGEFDKNEKDAIVNATLGKISKLYNVGASALYYTNLDISNKPAMCDGAGTQPGQICTDYVLRIGNNATNYIVVHCDSTEIGVPVCDLVVKSLKVTVENQTVSDTKQVEFSFKADMSNKTYKVTATIPTASKVYDADTSNNVFAKKRIDLGAANLIFSTPYETFPQVFKKGEKNIISNPNIGSISKLYGNGLVYYTTKDINNRPGMCPEGNELCSDYVLQIGSDSTNYLVVSCDTTDIGLPPCDQVVKSMKITVQ